MTQNDQHAQAAALRALHQSGIFVLPNAWDAGSAAIIARAGAKVIATTSAGVSWALGRPDGHGLTRAEMIDAVRRIAATVDVPVSADIEGGYGPGPDDVAATVEAVIAAGAVGVNLQDSRGGGLLFDSAEQAERLRAARAAAERAGLPELVINARTDVFLHEIGAPQGRLADVQSRSPAYAEAGADCLFVPGLVDLDMISALTKGPLPVNVMAEPGTPGVAALKAAGVRRVSVGSAISQAAYSLARRAAAELLADGTYAQMEGADSFGSIDGAFSR